jgi:hypothetical protein
MINLKYEQKLLLIGLIEELLIDYYGYEDLLTPEERYKVTERINETLDINAPRDLREPLIQLGRKLYEDVKEEL